MYINSAPLQHFGFDTNVYTDWVFGDLDPSSMPLEVKRATTFLQITSFTTVVESRNKITKLFTSVNK